jgi:Zn-dependent M28 family amino/carboxypeptidase
MAIAAVVKRHPLTCSVAFAAFDAEELGLRGSHAFVEALPFPRERLRLNINIDMIGRADDGRLFVSGVRYTPSLQTVVETAARTSAVPVHLGHDRPIYMTGLVDDWTNASDHGSFHDIGVPFLYFGVEDHADVHQPTDTADRIDARFYAASAETVLSALLAADGR